ncbi:hypothetical protein WN55_09975 [Dufourea novaeangliae]|uniref:Uncharacterized protein n=1 Tax=Dufourea novaeangliae TaxID=178035 RepID=A0A154P8A5_DUFNO|nr:hypothetical protein WN55_09975 [Dufourea novaeangliae]
MWSYSLKSDLQNELFREVEQLKLASRKAPETLNAESSPGGWAQRMACRKSHALSKHLDGQSVPLKEEEEETDRPTQTGKWKRRGTENRVVGQREQPTCVKERRNKGMTAGGMKGGAGVEYVGVAVDLHCGWFCLVILAQCHSVQSDGTHEQGVIL